MIGIVMNIFFSTSSSYFFVVYGNFEIISHVTFWENFLKRQIKRTIHHFLLSLCCAVLIVAVASGFLLEYLDGSKSLFFLRKTSKVLDINCENIYFSLIALIMPLIIRKHPWKCFSLHNLIRNSILNSFIINRYKITWKDVFRREITWQT